jgi:quercetin dioxygenase-like cupin family protein
MDNGFIKTEEDIKRKTLAYGDKSIMVKFNFKGGIKTSLHKHPQEQIGYLISGSLVIIVGDERHKMNQGDSCAIHGDTVHGVETLENSVALEIFTPLRKEYLPKETH